MTRKALSGSCPSCSSLLRKCVMSFIILVSSIFKTVSLHPWNEDISLIALHEKEKDLKNNQRDI